MFDNDDAMKYLLVSILLRDLFKNEYEQNGSEYRY